MIGLLILAIIVLFITSIILIVQNRSFLQKTNAQAETIHRMQNQHSQLVNQLQSSHSQAMNQVQQRIMNIAGEQFQRWREKECESIKLSEREIALREASNQLEYWKYESETLIRSDAIQRSQSVIIGKVSEHLLPYMPDFPYNPRDVKFLGSPVDLIVFDGMSDGDIKQIVLIEIKTGQSAALTQRERQIRNAVNDKNIVWQEMRIQRNN